MTMTYISTKDTAKLVRAALKRAFPTTKFSVRSSTYSMGSSIDVRWVDGPCAKAVEVVTSGFNGGNFDSMTDLKTSRSAWLLPDDGSAVLAVEHGGGMIPRVEFTKPHPDAREVRFSADSVHCQRELTYELVMRAYKRLEAKGYPVEAVEVTRSAYGTPSVRTLIWDRDKTRGFDMEREIMQAAYRTHCVTSAKKKA